MTFDPSKQPAYIKNLVAGYSWTGNAGQAAYNIGYNYLLPTPSLDSGSLVTSKKVLSDLQKLTLETKVFSLWSNVANVSFKAITGSKLTFGKGNLPSSNTEQGIAFTTYDTVTDKIARSEVYIKSDFPSYSPLTQGNRWMVHEVGHALGLADTKGKSTVDSMNVSVMSYVETTTTNNFNSLPITPMIYDIAAIQYLYGANYEYHSNGDTYTVKGYNQTWTIWDGGGKDTLDASSVANASLIDLRGGVDPSGKPYFSTINGNGEKENIAIAFDPKNTSKVVDIENGFGGAGADTIYGGYADNLLKGNGAADTIIGWGGKDTIYGGAGNDSLFVFKQNAADKPLNTTTIGTVFGEAGNDTIIGDNGNDTLDGGADNDIVKGGAGNDTIKDSAGANGLYGESGSDTIIGGKNNDTIVGGSNTADGFPDNDSIKGGDGADYILGGSGEDTIWGGIGNDTLEGGPGQDFLVGEGGDDTILITSSTDWARPDGGFNTINVVREGFITDPLPEGAYVGVPDIEGGNGVLLFDGKVVSGEVSFHDDGSSWLGPYHVLVSVAVFDPASHTLCPGGYLMISEERVSPGGSASAENLAVFVGNFQDGKYGITLPDWFWE